jgi:DNA-binding CsgD family transcriptional regulator
MSALRPPHPFSLIFQRSSCGKGFSERENAILEILNPHINNFLSIQEKYDLLSKKRGTTPEDIKACFPQLSKREAQVAERLCAGLSAREISSVLLIGVRTTQTHIAHLYEKLDVLNRHDAILMIRGKLGT